MRSFILGLTLVLATLQGSAQTVQTVAAPVTVGSYVWGYDDSLRPTGVSRLKWGADKAKTLGNVLRIELGYDQYGNYGFDPAVTPGQSDYLRTLAQLPDYAAVFSEWTGKTIILTTYTPAGFNHDWAFGLADLGRERLEYYNLATYLRDTYPTITWILDSWEGNWETNGQLAQLPAWQSFMRAKVLGVKESGAKNVFSAVEINCSQPGRSNPCMSTTVLDAIPAIGPDYVSYSAWQTINIFDNSTDSVALQQQMEADLGFILERLGPGYSGENLIIGEFGRRRDHPMPARQWFDAVYGAAFNLRVKYMIYWQAIDDPGTLQYGAFTNAGVITDNGYALQRLSRRWPVLYRKYFQ